MPARAVRAQVSETGRLSIPVAMRRALGLEKGGVVNLRLEEDGLHIESTSQFVRRIQAMARDAGWHDKVSVEEFLEWKREEARHEDAEYDRK